MVTHHGERGRWQCTSVRRKQMERGRQNAPHAHTKIEAKREERPACSNCSSPSMEETHLIFLTTQVATSAPPARSRSTSGIVLRLGMKCPQSPPVLIHLQDWIGLMSFFRFIMSYGPDSWNSQVWIRFVALLLWFEREKMICLGNSDDSTEFRWYHHIRYRTRPSRTVLSQYFEPVDIPTFFSNILSWANFCLL